MYSLIFLSMMAVADNTSNVNVVAPIEVTPIVGTPILLSRPVKPSTNEVPGIPRPTPTNEVVTCGTGLHPKPSTNEVPGIPRPTPTNEVVSCGTGLYPKPSTNELVSVACGKPEDFQFLKCNKTYTIRNGDLNHNISTDCLTRRSSRAASLSVTPDRQHYAHVTVSFSTHSENGQGACEDAGITWFKHGTNFCSGSSTKVEQETKVQTKESFNWSSKENLSTKVIEGRCGETVESIYYNKKIYNKLQTTPKLSYKVEYKPCKWLLTPSITSTGYVEVAGSVAVKPSEVKPKEENSKDNDSDLGSKDNDRDLGSKDKRFRFNDLDLPSKFSSEEKSKFSSVGNSTIFSLTLGLIWL